MNNNRKNNSLGTIPIYRKSGKEKFRFNSKNLDFSLLDFWQWSGSDLIGNTARGILAEFIIAKALGVSGDVRLEWAPYDIKTENDIKVEVKSASYLQSWQQKQYSRISFDIRKTFDWDEWAGEFKTEKKRQSDVYVFCLLKHKDKSTLNPLKLEQWNFYILTTSVLNEHCSTQKRISLSKLLQLNPIKTQYTDIKKAVYNYIPKSSLKIDNI